MRARLAVVLGCLLGGSVAQAQPNDPYAPGADDPVLAEEIAAQLVQRAQQLYDARQYVDARKLAREAYAESPTGAAGKQATYIIRAVDGLIGAEKGTPPPAKPTAPPPTPTPTPPPTPIPTPTGTANTSFGPSPGDTSMGPTIPPPPVVVVPRDPNAIPEVGEYGPGIDPVTAPPPSAPLPPIHLADEPTPVHPRRHEKVAAALHGGLYLGLLGATVGSFFADEAVVGAIPTGATFAVAGILVTPRLTDKLHWSAAQIRTAGSLSTWGGMVGGFFGDIAQSENTSASDVLVGAAIGSTLGLAVGAAVAKTNSFTSGDIALVDTLAGAGTVGGLTLGMLMQPAQNEAYSLNAVFGALGGVVVGLVAAPRTNTTPRRVLRVAAYTAAGGALPFLLYGAIRDSSTAGDERLVGFLSTGGLVAGLWLGFRQTRGLDAGRDVKGGATPPSDAPAALVGRSSDGTWALNGLGVSSLSPQLAPQPGLALTLVSGSL